MARHVASRASGVCRRFARLNAALAMALAALMVVGLCLAPTRVAADEVISDRSVAAEINPAAAPNATAPHAADASPLADANAAPKKKKHGPWYNDYVEAEKHVDMLTFEQGRLADNASLAEVIGSGTWLVFYGVSWCGHCQKFTPKWLDAQRRVKANQARTPLRLGKVLCEHYESLCQEQNVQLYPSIRLYHRGAFIREYENLDAPTDGFYDWILQQIKAFNSKVTDSMHTTGDASSYPGEDRHVADDADISAAAGVLSAAAAVEAVADDVDATASTAQVASDVAAWTALARDAAKPRVVPNPDGIVVEMFEQDFAAQLDKGPWFIMFHASWCGHCQHLAPVWERLGPELLQQVNVGKIECTVNPNACNNYAIRGYPTLKYINQAAGLETEYNGDRSVRSMTQWAKQQHRVPFEAVDAARLQQLQQKEEVVFVFLVNGAPAAEAETMLGALLATTIRYHSHVTVVVCPDAGARERVMKAMPAPLASQDPHAPRLVVSREHGRVVVPYTGLLTKDRGDQIALNEWVQQHRHPLVVELHSGNSNEILGGDRLVVLGIFNMMKPESATMVKRLREHAQAWNARQQAVDTDTHRAGTPSLRPVMFTTIDGANWSNYISRVYGFQTHELPRLLVGDPHADAYWDVDADGTDLVDRLGSLGAPTDPLMQALTDVLVGKVPGKSTGSFVDRVLRRFARAMAPVVHAYTTHPVWMTLFMLLAIGGGLFVCLGLATPADYRPVRNDPKAD